MTLLPGDLDLCIQVVGPAYLDEIVEVEGALCGPEWVREALPGPTGKVRIDYSRTEAGRRPLDERGVFLQVESPYGDRIRVKDPDCADGRALLVEEERLFEPASVGLPRDREVPPLRTDVRLVGTRVQPGGMGAGYALALGARLVLPVGAGEQGPDPDGRAMLRMLDEHGVDHAPVAVPDAATDVTTLLWSLAGDKLPVGRRSACRAVTAEALLERAVAADLNVVTSLPNPTAHAVATRFEGWTLFAPSLRNVRHGGVEEVAEAVDAVSMNGTEWGGLADAERVRAACQLVLVTQGEQGMEVSFRDEGGRLRWLSVPAAPVERVMDANHAGEACAAGFLGAVLDLVGMEGLREGAFAEGAVREAALQAAHAAALELGYRELKFPSRADVQQRRATWSDGGRAGAGSRPVGGR